MSSNSTTPSYNSKPVGQRIPVWYSDNSKHIVVARLKPMHFFGTPNTGWTALEYGDATRRHTLLTSTSSVATFAPAGAANQALGNLVYTFPVKDCCIGSGARMKIGFTAAVTPAATPVIGLGTVVGVGAVAVLTGTATFIDVMGSQTVTVTCNGTVAQYIDAKTAVPKLGSSAPKLFLNIAAAWAAADVLTIGVGSTIMFNWSPMDTTEEMV